MAGKNTAYKKLGILSLAAVIFFTISGGPYGLEPLLFYCGGNGALLLLVAVPLFWDIPIVLCVLELNSQMPVAGGYYQWIKKALGLRWAFYDGWWAWLCIFIDLAIYPQLVILYAGLFFPEITAYKIPICWTIIWVCAYINIRGIVSVGRTTIILSVLTLLPFVVLFAIGAYHYPLHISHNMLTLNDHTPFLGMAIFTIIWNFMGWDNVTTYANEVNKPASSYLKAISVAFAFIFILYIGVILIAQKTGISPQELRDKGFPALGYYIGGQWLSVTIAIAGIVSSIGLFLAVLLSISRIPEVMSADKLLPAKLHALHPKYKSPYISIIISACIVSGMILWSFGELLIIDVSVYFVGLTLEFLSLIVLRIREPHAPRPFRIPFNIIGLCIMLTLPIIVYFIALSDIISKSKEALKPLLFAVLMILSAELAWRIIELSKTRRLNK